MFDEELDNLSKHYSDLFDKYGDSPEGVQWSSRDTQIVRLKILTEIAGLQNCKVLDFGCGTGTLYEYLSREYGFTGEYVGYDICPSSVSFAQRKFRGIRFEVKNIFKEKPEETFDYILISGVFNNRMNDNWGYFKNILRCLYPCCSKGLGFNALSRYVDYYNEGLYYFSPEDVIGFCKKELSPYVCMRHDYAVKPRTIPFEFTTYIYKKENIEHKHSRI